MTKSFRIAALAVTALSIAASSNLLSQASPAAAAPPDYSKEPSVIERSFLKINFQNDGRYTEEVTGRVRVQSQAALETFGLLHFPFASATSTMEIVYVRVLRPDGGTVQTPADSVLETTANITRQAPFYSDLKEKQIPVRGLAVGATLEFQYRTQVNNPIVPGQFWFSYDFLNSGIILDEELQISIPRDRNVTVKSAHIQPTITDQAGMRIYNWKTANLKPATEEKDSSPSKPDEIHAVQLTTFRSWDEVGQWFKSLATPQASVTPAIQAKARELTLSAKNDSEKMHALYDFVSTKFRYIGVSLGIGRYQPHTAEEVLSNEFGDCKDKHTLFAALLSAAGIKAYPVLINSGQKVDPDVPYPGQFNHVITALPQQSGFLFLDTTPEVAPFALLVDSIRDKKALLIPSQGSATLVQTPADPPFKSFFNFQADGTLDSAGTLVSKMQMTFRGDAELLYRAIMRQADQTRWKDLIQNVSSRLGFAGTVDNVTATPPEQTTAPFEIRYTYNRKDYSDWENRRIRPPFPPEFLPDAPEETDKDPEAVQLGAPTESLYRATINLPEGAAPVVPAAIDVHERFADYHAEYSFTNGALIFERRLQTKVREIPLAEIGAYRKFYKAAMDDTGNFIAVSIRSGPPAVASTAAPGSYKNPEPLLAYVGHPFLIREHGGLHQVETIRKEDAEHYQGICDKAVQVKSATFTEDGAVQFDVEDLGLVLPGGATPPECFRAEATLMSKLLIPGFQGQETQSELELVIDHILQTPESYLASYGVSPLSTESGQQNLGNLPTGPRQILNVMPWFPKEARDKREPLELSLQMTVAADGKLQDVKIVSGEGSGLDTAVLRVIPLWRYTPARRNGQFVASPTGFRLSFNVAPPRTP